MGGVPLPKVSLVDKRFEAFATTYAETLILDEVSFARIKSELDRLSNISEFKAPALMRLAHLYSYKFDVGRFRSCLESAKNLIGVSNYWKYAFVSGAVNLGLFEEAREVLDSYDTHEVQWLNFKITIYTSLGLVESAVRAIESVHAMESSDNKLIKNPELVSRVYRVLDVLKDHGCDQEMLYRRICLASKVVIDEIKKPLVQYAITAGYEAGVIYSFAMNEDVNLMVDLEWKMAEALIEAFDDEIDAITINVRYCGD